MTSEAKIVTIEEVIPHPNADRLDMVRHGGWWSASQKGINVGDKKLFLPPDTIVPLGQAVRWGIDAYTQTTEKGERVRATRLRGQASFGVLLPITDDIFADSDLDSIYGISKYEPPLKEVGKDCVQELPGFPRYYKLGHLAENPYMFNAADRVQVAEKIHGTNFRVGKVNGELVAGSHNTQRQVLPGSLYALPLQHEGVVRMLNAIEGNVVLYGEIFGQGIQDMRYGQEFPTWRAFDIAQNGRFLSVREKGELFAYYSIPAVPVLYAGLWDHELIMGMVDGPTTVCRTEDIKEPFKGREGIVITAYGTVRKIARVISVDYHARENRNQTEEH